MARKKYNIDEDLERQEDEYLEAIAGSDEEYEEHRIQLDDPDESEESDDLW
jgi:hypothetical protein